ncbi:MAG: DUF2585 family protein [Rhodobacteraceae bacterium]|nr:DUF2585 family protein [Paracoccaceae bacterium]
MTNALHIIAALGPLLVGVTLWAWGQPLVSTSGEIRLWVHSVWSSENSQQIADWYSLSHFIHGMLVIVIAAPFRRWIGWPAIYAVAIVTGVAWEIVEHTSWVLDRFRATTLYQGYLGDTVLNAVCDYIFMLSGFALASAITLRWTVALIVVLEITATAIARDSLTLTTIGVIHPVEAIEAWQQEVKPEHLKNP